MKKKIFFKIIYIIFILQLSSCGLKVVENHGQIYDKNISFDEFEVGKTTKQEISNILGSPSTESSFDNKKTWYYISSEFKKFVFLDGENTDQKILVFDFNENILSNKNILSKEDINDIESNIKVSGTAAEDANEKKGWWKTFIDNLSPANKLPD